MARNTCYHAFGLICRSWMMLSSKTLIGYGGRLPIYNGPGRLGAYPFLRERRVQARDWLGIRRYMGSARSTHSSSKQGCHVKPQRALKGGEKGHEHRSLNPFPLAFQLSAASSIRYLLLWLLDILSWVWGIDAGALSFSYWFAGPFRVIPRGVSFQSPFFLLHQFRHALFFLPFY